MNRPIVLVACTAVLLAGSASASRAEGPAEPVARFADTGLPDKAALEAQDAQAHLAPEAPASGSDFRPTSVWVGQLPDGAQVALYAGQHGWQSTDGRALLVRFGPDLNLAWASMVEVPGAGRLRVTDGDAAGVVVTDSTGSTWTIDPGSGSVR